MLPVYSRTRGDDYINAKLSAIIKEHTLLQLPPPLLCLDSKPPSFSDAYVITPDELLQEWPNTVPGRMDRALCNLAILSPLIGQIISISREDFPILFAVSSAEVTGIVNALKADGLVDGSSTSSGFSGSITPAGWRRIRDLLGTRASREAPAFVAMWFGGEEPAKQAEMSRLYDEGIMPAVQACGYKLGRVDLEEHNEYIMDKIRAMIRVAPFVVADFTGHRNGVYLETGMAMGREIPVIACCKRDAFDHAHFDTKQLNHILWNNPQDMKERLQNRILGSIGQGPYPIISTK